MDSQGTQAADPNKTAAIHKMNPPSDMPELRRNGQSIGDVLQEPG